MGQPGVSGASISSKGWIRDENSSNLRSLIPGPPQIAPLKSEPNISSRRKTPTMKAVYLLPCSCGKKVRVDAGQAGAKVDCECGQQLAVPTFRMLRSLEVDAVPVSSADRTSQPASWNAVRGILFSFGLLITVIAVGVGSFQFFLYFVRRDGGESLKQAVIEDMSHGVEHLSPDEVLTEFQEMAHKGLTIDGVPPWAVITEVRNENFRYFMVALVSLVVGLACLTASLFSGGRRISRQ